MSLKKRLIFIAVTIVFIVISIFFPYDLYLSLDQDMFVTSEVLEQMLDTNFFINSSLKEVSSNNDQFDEYIINYKLF